MTKLDYVISYRILSE